MPRPTPIYEKISLPGLDWTRQSYLGVQMNGLPYALLVYLASPPDKLRHYDCIRLALWGSADGPSVLDGSITASKCTLAKWLKAMNAPVKIHNIRGAGYILKLTN